MARMLENQDETSLWIATKGLVTAKSPEILSARKNLQQARVDLLKNDAKPEEIAYREEVARQHAKIETQGIL